MSIVIGVKFPATPKMYYFSPKKETFVEGDIVIVETARGIEHGKVVMSNQEVDDSQIVQPLKEIIRRANDADKKRIEENNSKRAEALKIAVEKAGQINPEMKVVDVEYTFDQQKIIIYFTADNRVDFRELVRVLAGVYKKRIELRQIDERDDYRIKGGLATCGRPCCCSLYQMGDNKASIKMAKVQGLSLNPTKISGLCGKLMCCLRYENEYYSEISKQMPKQGAKINFDGAEAVVESRDFLKKTLVLRFESSEGVQKKQYQLNDFLAKMGKTEFVSDSETADDE